MTSLQLTSKQATAKKVNAEIKIKTFCEFNNPAAALQVLAEFNALEDEDGLSLLAGCAPFGWTPPLPSAVVEITLGWANFRHDGPSDCSEGGSVAQTPSSLHSARTTAFLPFAGLL